MFFDLLCMLIIRCRDICKVSYVSKDAAVYVISDIVVIDLSTERTAALV